jgi:ribosomal protein S18 acetylase RimI-like enzyme
MWELFAAAGNVIGYEADGSLAGALAFTRGQHHATVPKPALYIEALEVLEDFRRNSLGRTLVREAQSESVRLGFGGNMYAVVNKSQPTWRDNVAAMQALGFEVVEEGNAITLFFSP